MPPKRRKLSPSASSQSSNTTSLPAGPGPSRYLPASSPPLGPEDSATPGPGPSTQSHALAKTSGRARIQDDRVIAKPGVIVPGSGDGGECGDECFLWTDLPMNKIGYRYSPCGPSPSPSLFPSLPFYRIIPFPYPTPQVHISWLDRSQYLRLSPDAMTVTTDRGFRSGRSNMSVREGSWYFEATVLRGDGSSGASRGSGGEGGNAHVRVGWGRREAGLDAPVGADGYAYGIRDVGGEYIHCSRSTKSGSAKGFGTGDTIGCFIHLPKRQELPQEGEKEGGKEEEVLTMKKGMIEGHRTRISIRYKAQNYFETEEYPVQKEMDALVDRDGKYAQARAEAAMELANGGVGDMMDSTVNSGPRGKKTKNVKKGKKDKESQQQQPIRPQNIMANFRDLKRLPGSRIEFTINGQSISDNPAFEDLYDYIPLKPTPIVSTKKSDQEEKLPDDGSLGYYPMISCFGRGKLKLNFGPDFLFPPKGDPKGGMEGEGIRAMSERWDEWKDEEKALDEKEEKELTDLMIKEAEEDKERQKVEDKKAAIAAAKAKMVGSPLSGKSGRATPTPGPGINPNLNSMSVSSKLVHDMSINGDEGGEGIKDESSSRAGDSRQDTPTPYSSVQGEGTPLGSVKRPKQAYKGKRKKWARGRARGKVTLGRDDPSRANSILSTEIIAQSQDSDLGPRVEGQSGIMSNGVNEERNRDEVGMNGERSGDGMNGDRGDENGHEDEGEDEDAEGEIDAGWEDDDLDAEGEMDIDGNL